MASASSSSGGQHDGGDRGGPYDNTSTILPHQPFFHNIQSCTCKTGNEPSRWSTRNASPPSGSFPTLALLVLLILAWTPATVAPTLLLGVATAILYRSVLRHPNANLTNQSVTYMLMLAVQVAIQPKISQWNVLPADNKVTVAFMEEVVKTSLAALLWLLQDAKARRLSLRNWSFSSSVWVAGLPAALYAAQGVLTYTSLQRLDAVTFNGLSQLKTVSAAIFCYAILGTVQTPRQIAAIALLLVSSLLFQHRQRPAPPPKKGNDNGASASPGFESAGNQLTNVASSLTGVSACLLATTISGFAGALSQRGLQRAVRAGALHGRDPFLYCGEVSMYSALCLLVTSLVKRLTRTRQPALATSRERPKSLSSLSASIRSMRWSLWIPVTVKAMGGIVTVLVHKHAGSVPKGFALVLGLVLSGMLEPDSLSLPKLAGTVLVLLSSWMHFTSSS
jgi:solute carrier family 35 (UDP-sugar transporter), member A1/2/3